MKINKMPRTFLTVSVFMMYLLGWAQAPPKLIVRGDDMGFSHSGNLAVVESYKNGIETTIEVIVPSPWFPEAVKMLKELPNVDVGVHVALTSEWDNIKYRPLTEAKSLVDADGYFYPMIYKNDNYPGNSLKENNWKLEDIEKEMRAQIEMALRKIPQVSHITCHMGCATMSPEVGELSERLTKEYNIYVDMGNVERVTFIGEKSTSEQKTQSFIAMLNSLQDGHVYLFVEHPGIDNEELRAIHLKGYEDVAQDRQGVTDVYTNESVKKVIKDKGIELIGYDDLVEDK